MPQPPKADVLWFNGQKRNLDTGGSQGPVMWLREKAEDVCETYCEEHCDGMEALRGHERSECHVVEYESLDDMCVHCKKEGS